MSPGPLCPVSIGSESDDRPTEIFQTLAGLTVVFRRWKREGAATADPTDADRELVAAALADDARGSGAGAAADTQLASGGAEG